MKIKLIDIYLTSKYPFDTAKHYLDKLLEEHILEDSDFDLEHFREILEESNKFKIIEDEDTEDFDLEYTQEDIEAFVEKLLYDEEDISDEDEDDIFEEDDEDDEEDFEEDDK